MTEKKSESAVRHEQTMRHAAESVKSPHPEPGPSGRYSDKDWEQIMQTTEKEIDEVHSAMEKSDKGSK